MSLFDEKLKEVIDDETKTRYILRQNPIRKLEIRETRESKIVRLKSFIELKTNYYNEHFRAKSETLTKNIDKKISSLKLSKFITYEINYKSGDCKVVKSNGESENKIKELATVKIVIDKEARKKVEELDGCYVVKTSLIDPKKETKEEIHKAYKTLIKVENAFKTLKTDFLEIRPLYLKMDKRIKGHIALSMIAYNIVLKLKNFISLSELDFKSTIRNLTAVKTVQNNINIGISYETIPNVCDDLKNLFQKMNLKLPLKI